MAWPHTVSRGKGHGLGKCNNSSTGAGGAAGHETQGGMQGTWPASTACTRAIRSITTNNKKKRMTCAGHAAPRVSAHGG